MSWSTSSRFCARVSRNCRGGRKSAPQPRPNWARVRCSISNPWQVETRRWKIRRSLFLSISGCVSVCLYVFLLRPECKSIRCLFSVGLARDEIPRKRRLKIQLEPCSVFQDLAFSSLHQSMPHQVNTRLNTRINTKTHEHVYRAIGCLPCGVILLVT
jgi:hypothetical protein